MTNNDWQERVLPDDELQRLLANTGALEGMQILQRQLELRSADHAQSSSLRTEVPNHLELGMTDFVPVITSAEESASEIVADATPEVIVEPTALQPEVVEIPANAPATPATDIAANLNALFANRQKVEITAPPAIAVTPVEHVLPTIQSAPSDYQPVPLESVTKSFFIPTFANPLPNTQSIEVVTPMVTPEVAERAVVAGAAVESAPVEPDTAELPVVAPVPVYEEPPVVRLVSPELDIPSAEEAITAFEEADTTSQPQPNLVDQVILEAGGIADTGFVQVLPEPIEAAEESFPLTEPETALPAAAAPTAATAAETKPNSSGHLPTGRRGLRALVATWNGTGNLLFLIAAGFIAASLHFNLITVLAGSFGALAAAGFGFGTAALAARRGRQPQATISRAAFGVRGAAIPLVFVILARYAASAVALTGAVFATLWFYPTLPTTVNIGSWNLPIFYLVMLVIVMVAAAVTILGSAARFIVTLAMAGLTVIWALITVLTAAVSAPEAFNAAGSLNAGKALALASALIIFISLVWGTTAADETPDLRSDIVAPKLLAAGLASHAVLGTLAVLSGFVFFGLNIAVFKNGIFGFAFAIVAILALSHQIRRTSDSFSGFGLSGTRWWVVVLSTLLVVVGVVFGHAFVSDAEIKSGALSLLPVAGVPVVAALAIFGIDSVLRREDYHEVSLLRDYGFYGKFNWVNLGGWALAVVVGLGFVESPVPGFTWLGYLSHPLGFAATGARAAAGVWIAFLIGLLTPLLTIARIRDQEAEGIALQARHKELLNVLGDL